MIDPSTALYVFHDDNSTFLDYTDQAKDYLRDEFSVQLSSTEDYLYVGYYKPFGSTYVELPTPNTTTNSFVAEYWNGTAWTVMTMTDETNGMTRSGFWFWDKEDMVALDINGQTAVWMRVRPSADHTATTVRAANIVFSDDTSLKQEFFEIDNSNLLPAGETSHINVHVSSRNYMVQKFRNLGYIKTNETTGDLNITSWDLMDVFEVREAATYLALSKIFFNLSDDQDDHWWAKYREYQNKFEGMKWPTSLTVDTDDDGLTDDSEKLAQVNVRRWVR